MVDGLDDVKTGIGITKDAFNKRKELLTRSIRVDLRKRLVKTLVWPEFYMDMRHGP